MLPEAVLHPLSPSSAYYSWHMGSTCYQQLAWICSFPTLILCTIDLCFPTNSIVFFILPETFFTNVLLVPIGWNLFMLRLLAPGRSGCALPLPGLLPCEGRRETWGRSVGALTQSVLWSAYVCYRWTCGPTCTKACFFSVSLRYSLAHLSGLQCPFSLYYFRPM